LRLPNEGHGVVDRLKKVFLNKNKKALRLKKRSYLCASQMRDEAEQARERREI